MEKRHAQLTVAHAWRALGLFFPLLETERSLPSFGKR